MSKIIRGICIACNGHKWKSSFFFLNSFCEFFAEDDASWFWPLRCVFFCNSCFVKPKSANLFLWLWNAISFRNFCRKDFQVHHRTDAICFWPLRCVFFCNSCFVKTKSANLFLWLWNAISWSFFVACHLSVTNFKFVTELFFKFHFFWLVDFYLINLSFCQLPFTRGYVYCNSQYKFFTFFSTLKDNNYICLKILISPCTIFALHFFTYHNGQNAMRDLNRRT